MEDVSYPMDKNLYLFKATNGKIVGLHGGGPADTRAKRVKAQLHLRPRSAANEVPKAMNADAAALGKPRGEGEPGARTSPSFDFYVTPRTRQSKRPRFKVRVFFKANLVRARIRTVM
jgi:hypothetical protein